MFDLDAIDTKSRSEGGASMTVKTLDGKPLLNSAGEAVTIKVRGPDSTIYSQLVRAQVKKRMARSGMPTEEQSLEDEADLIELLVNCTIGWSGILKKPEKDEAEASSV